MPKGKKQKKLKKSPPPPSEAAGRQRNGCPAKTKPPMLSHRRLLNWVVR
jgi:hypothetical protein